MKEEASGAVAESRKRIQDKITRLANKFDHITKSKMKFQNFEQMNFGTQKYDFKQKARNLPMIGPLHFMILRLE